jgi:hypothetical protein
LFCVSARSTAQFDQARPLVFGFLPVGIAYHALYCLGASLIMWLLVRHAWPCDM